MNVTQIASVAAAFEAARMAGIQQAGSSAAAVSVQRETNRAAAEADVSKTQAVQETEERSGRPSLSWLFSTTHQRAAAILHRTKGFCRRNGCA